MGVERRRMSPFLRGLAGMAGLAAISLSLSGYEKLPPLSPYRTETPPVLDGVLDDPVWKLAPSETGFKTWTPDFGREMAEKTVVYYAYDRENLYFAFRCYDREPSKIKATLAARDTIRRDDWVCLNLDSFDDAQSLYAFYVNPLGIQGDSRLEGALDNEDYTVDVVWYSVGKIDLEGYVVEIKIPFKSIRYRRRDPVSMGIIFERRVSRQSEQGTYPPLDPALGPNFLTQMRPLRFADIRHYTLFEALPAATYGRQSTLEEGALRAQKATSDLSLTAKLGVTSQLIFDGTLNPDFSQVESDAGQVDFNLRYALFYPEKRPFFLEGREKFSFAASQSGDPLDAAVHTRTIVNPHLAFKLNGKVGAKDGLAVLYALDELPAGGPGEAAHFTVVRYKHALPQD
ncbi:MAG: carbohydrate binding family 9 domain-containing protein, partial [Candidatus Aminicenantes bacterium]|nr:carbohydrate binding family 9 domain-containing protein [Candidatus Aminicenantes bacterium]